LEKLSASGTVADSPNRIDYSGLAACAESMAKQGGGVSSLVFRISLCLCALLAASGCTRTRYRLRADAEAYSILTEKSASTPWRLPFGFSVEPDPRSRFCDASPTDDPWLPVPAPQLYAYSLPDLPERDPGRFGGPVPASTDIAHDASRRETDTITRSASEEPNRSQTVASPALRVTSPCLSNSVFETSEAVVRHLTDVLGPRTSPSNATAMIRPVVYQADPAGLTPENEASTDHPTLADEDADAIPENVWHSLPTSCLTRMFEFTSMREEYRGTFGREPSADQLDHSQRLALEDIVELALINSRQYQTQKEVLYRTAMRLSLERFDYDMKFSTSGNRSAVDHSHNRTAGITQDSLGIPTTITENALLATGGDLLARFANDVVLTFNGPNGFAADVGSDLLLDISHSVFQRDDVLEGLTQAERNVVYAARDFVRFRKQLFAGLASRYYRLLLAYRGIEIDAQDYFSNLRRFHEFRKRHRLLPHEFPRFQVDQFEQSTLVSRSRLIGSCNDLERSLDELKIEIGLPPELPVNLDMAELQELTRRDEATAAAARVRRWQRDLQTERDDPTPHRRILANAAINLVQRMLDLIRLRARLGRGNDDADALLSLQNQLLDKLMVDEAELEVEFKRQVLIEEEQTAPRPQDLDIIWRSSDLVDSLFILMARQLTLAERLGDSARPIAGIRRELPGLKERHKQLQDRLKQAIDTRQLELIPGLVPVARTLLADTEALAVRAAALMPARPLTDAEALQQMLAQVDQLITASRRMLDDDIGGLAPVSIEMDDAMLTALTLRFDLMNQRGELADVWRQIKLAGDDLKSILNLRATEQIRTRSDVNRPFDFTFDDSQTQLAMTFDAPLNRKAQRNLFRLSLIDYNAGLRSLMALEDSIKLSVRNDLRQLQVDREQYQIAVASAALAYDRVVSTQEQYDRSINNVTARDVLESQQDYTTSLIALARAHIDYILDRIGLFQDLELLEVDDSGFWPMLYDTQLQPEPNYEIPFFARPVYGDLPRRTWHSHKIKRMLGVPAGEAIIFETDPAPPSSSEELPAPRPDQPTASDSQE